MRGTTHRRHAEDEEESAFVSMTDMTVSFLFIVMIMLAFFASQLHEDDSVPRRDFDAVVSERDLSRKQVELLEAKVSRLEDEVNGLRNDVRSREERIQELERQLAEARKTVEALGEDVSRLTDALGAANNTIAELRDKLAEQAKRIEALELKVKDLEEILRRAKDDPLERYLAEVASQQRRLLEAIQAKLKVDFPTLQVIVSEEMDALRFKGDGLFKRGESSLQDDKRKIVEVLADRLNELLPCYTLGPGAEWNQDCNSVGAVIEAVQIEGHTDSNGREDSNLVLSTGRANATFFAMTTRQPTLVQHLNSRRQPVLSVAGYGQMRPVVANDTPENKATNRRIDLRIIMYSPRSLDDIEKIRGELKAGLSGGGAP